MAISKDALLEGNHSYASLEEASIPKITSFDSQSIKTSLGKIGIAEITVDESGFNSDLSHQGMSKIDSSSITMHQIGINQSSRRKIGMVENCTTNPSFFQICSSEIGSSKVTATIKFGANGLDISHFRIDKFAVRDISTSEIGIVEDGFAKIYIDEFGKPQIGSTQVSSLPITFLSLQSSQISSNQVSSSQSNIVHPSFEQNSGTQIGISQVNRTTSNFGEISSTEIDTTEIESGFPGRNTITKPNNIKINPTQIDSTKVSFPSSITLQQFLNSNLSYNSTSLLTGIYSTAQTLWQTTTPINLNFEITNLPTGQLAVRVALR